LGLFFFYTIAFKWRNPKQVIDLLLCNGRLFFNILDDRFLIIYLNLFCGFLCIELARVALGCKAVGRDGIVLVEGAGFGPSPTPPTFENTGIDLRNMSWALNLI